MSGSETRTALEDRAARQTQESIRHLVEQLRSPLGVIPFVGAGFSAPFEFPQWGELLHDLSEHLGREDREKARAAVDREEYTGAATIVGQALGEFDFQSAIAANFPDEDLARVDLAEASIAFVPLLTSGLVITTNFDGALEYVFDRAGRRPSMVYGANPNEIVPAIQQNRLTLWKVHGDRKDPRTRVLSTEDYETHYRHLYELLALAFANRPALFLGCSLKQDKTVTILRGLQERWQGVKHFAVLECPADEETFDARSAELRKLGIRPIWYPNRAHGKIRPLLSEIAQRASAYRLAVANDATTAPMQVGPNAAIAARVILDDELAGLAVLRPDFMPDERPRTPCRTRHCLIA